MRARTRSWLWMLVWIACSSSVVSPARAGSSQLPLVPLVGTVPTVDGDLSDECWSTTLTVELDRFWDAARRQAGVRPRDPTQVGIVCDQEQLYVAFHCVETNPQGSWVYRNEKLVRRGNSHVLDGDHVAVAVDMGRFGFYSFFCGQSRRRGPKPAGTGDLPDPGCSFRRSRVCCRLSPLQGVAYRAQLRAD